MPDRCSPMSDAKPLGIVETYDELVQALRNRIVELGQELGV